MAPRRGGAGSVIRPALADKVHMRAGGADGDLNQLYRRCASILLSLLEGWGLPVTVALVHGKVPVIGGTSSLPEAVGDYAVYVDADPASDMATTIASLLGDPASLTDQEGLIHTHFRPRGWATVVADMIAISPGRSFRGEVYVGEWIGGATPADTALGAMVDCAGRFRLAGEGTSRVQAVRGA